MTPKHGRMPPAKQSSANKLSILHSRYLKLLTFLINCYVSEHGQYLVYIISFSPHNNPYNKPPPLIYHFKEENFNSPLFQSKYFFHSVYAPINLLHSQYFHLKKISF